MKNIDLAVPAAEQHGGNGASPLAAALRNAGGGCVPAVWRGDAATAVQARLGGRVPAGFVRTRTPGTGTKPGQPNIRKQYTHMTRVSADGEGGSGPYPLRAQPA